MSGSEDSEDAPVAPRKPAPRGPGGRPRRDPEVALVPLGKRLRWIRESKGLGQAEVRALLEKLGVHVANSTYSGWETGKTYPTIPQLIALSRCLGVSADVLLCLEPLVLE